MQRSCMMDTNGWPPTALWPETRPDKFKLHPHFMNMFGKTVFEIKEHRSLWILCGNLNWFKDVSNGSKFHVFAVLCAFSFAGFSHGSQAHSG